MDEINETITLKEQDIILVSMSTLPKSIQGASTFVTPEGNRVSNCVSQLECVVRYLLNQNDHDVIIVPICTKQTLLPVKDLEVSPAVAKIVNERWGEEAFVPGDKRPNSKDAKNKSERSEVDELSSKANDSFRRRVKRALQRRRISLEFDDVKKIISKNTYGIRMNRSVHFAHTPKEPNLSSEKTKRESQKQLDSNSISKDKESSVYKLSGDQNAISAYQFFKNQINGCEEKDNKKIAFYDDSSVDLPIEIDQANIFPAIKRTTDELRKLLKKYPNSHLYIDNHGGFRDISLVLCAVLSLLKYDEPHGNNIPEKVYGVRNEPNQPEKKIVDETRTYAIFDFITGMNDFINFGSAKVLKNYYDEFGDHTDKTIQITDAMEKISNGTQLCSSRLYTRGLNKFAEQIKDEKESRGSEVDVLLSIFLENIENDYGNTLLDPHQTQSVRSFEIVKRCIDKGLYQQALTFIESQMPKYYCEFIVEIQNEKQGRDRYNNKRIRKRLTIDEKKEFENQIIDTLTYTLHNERVPRSSSSSQNQDSGKKIISEWQNIIQKIGKNQDIQDKKWSEIYRRLGKYKGENNVAYYIPKGPKYNVCIKLNAAEQGDPTKNFKFLSYTLIPRKTENFNSDKFLELLILHKELKDRRNMFNHSDTRNDPNIQELNNLLKRYVSLVSELSISK